MYVPCTYDTAVSVLLLPLAARCLFSSMPRQLSADPTAVEPPSRASDMNTGSFKRTSLQNMRLQSKRGMFEECQAKLNQRIPTQDEKLRGDLPQFSIDPTHFSRTCRPRDPFEHTWDQNICVCHIRAAKLVAKGHRAELNMPSEGVFEALQKHAITLGLPQRDVNMAVDCDDLRQIIDTAKSEQNQQPKAGCTMQFATIEPSALQDEFDQDSVKAWLDQSEIAEQDGRRQLCEVMMTLLICSLML